MNTLKTADMIREYGVGPTNYAQRYADQFNLEVEDVAADIASGMTVGQATLGKAVLNSDKDTFDFAWQSSDELHRLMDDLDGVQGNYDPSQDGYSARQEIVEAAFTDGNDVELVGTLNSDGTVTQTVQFDVG